MKAHDPHRTRTDRIPRCALAAVAILALAACGSDDDGRSDVDDSDLAGRTFVATTIEGAALVDGSTLALTFDDDRVAASGGCNTSTGVFDVDDGTLAVEDMAQTMMACQPPELMDQDTWVIAFLTSAPTITLADRALTLATDSITIAFEEG